MKMAICCIVLGLSVMLSGCAPSNGDLPATVPASGVVTLDGSPVEGAAVTFIADSGTYHATGITDSSGEFNLKAFDEKDGAVPGSYQVQVNKTVVSGGEGNAGTEGEATVNIQFGLPKKYASSSSSGLTATIPEEGTAGLKLELTSD